MEEYQSDIKDIISHNFLVWWHICPFLMHVGVMPCVSVQKVMSAGLQTNKTTKMYKEAKKLFLLSKYPDQVELLTGRSTEHL